MNAWENNIVNLTPHELRIHDKKLAGEQENVLVAVVPPSGVVARVEVVREQVGNMSHPDSSRAFAVYKTKTTGATELPPRKKGTVFVVSGMYLSANPRSDVYAPGELLRDDSGRVIGCIGLSQ